MVWNKLHLLVIFYLIVWLFTLSMSMKMLQIKSLKITHVTAIQLKFKLQNSQFEFWEKEVLSDAKKTHWFKYYQLENKEDFYDEFINSKKNWSNTKWMVFQWWSIWEAKPLDDILETNEYTNVYLVYIYQNLPNIIKIK